MTIVNLAQDYVGSNNINLLMPNGQFGTRDQGGKDHASARYIFTEPSPMARALFHFGDDPLLKYLQDDNNVIEPEWYLPVIPFVLVNGAEGIGTGMSICTIDNGCFVLLSVRSRMEHKCSLLQPDGNCCEHSSPDGRTGARTNASVVARLQGEHQESW